MQRFDQTQADLLALTDGKHFVSAPPGAGKTALLTARLQASGLAHFADDEIVCLTFTVRAALEMQQRAARVLGDRNPFIGNFHAFCMHVLRETTEPRFRHLKWQSLIPEEYAKELIELAVVDALATPIDYHGVPEVLLHSCDVGQVAAANVYQPSWTRIMQSLQAGLALLSVAIESDDHWLLSVAQQLLQSQLAQQVASAKALLGVDYRDLDHVIVRIYQVFLAYQGHKRASQAIDFDDLLVQGLACLRHAPQPKRFIQIDEVQDLNPLQWAIIAMLDAPDSHVFAVGDELQSIYGFLGADITQLQRNLQDFTQHQLINNYRAQAPLLTILNAYRTAHWQLPAIVSMRTRRTEATECSSNAVDKNATMLFATQTLEQEVALAARAVTQILADEQRNIGMLLPTNKLIEQFCRHFQAQGLRFFRVGENDLMQQLALVDAMSLLRLLNGVNTNTQRMDWWSIIFRFTRSGAGSRYTRKDIIAMVNAFAAKRLPLAHVLLGQALFDYPYRELLAAADDQGVVIFDTETTGLDFMSDKIIQIAAVKVCRGQVVAEFDEYVCIDLDGDAALDAAFANSQAIHHITREQVAKGGAWVNVLSEFLAFVGECPLLAHNLNYDLEMLKSNSAELTFAPDVQAQLSALLMRPCFDTLQLARLLYPDLASYKLESLLDTFTLAGVNSHNALDDVKATASLFVHMCQAMPEHLQQADALLDQYASIITPFRYAWQTMCDDFATPFFSPLDVELATSIDAYFSFAQQQDHWYNPQTLAQTRAEATQKYFPWLIKHCFQGIASHQLNANLYQYAGAEGQARGQLVAQLATLKETDLIDPERDKLIVSTVHRAKGLEFDTVYLPACVDSNYPLYMPASIPKDKRVKRENESKRLLYVALSRPTNKLIVSYHQQVGQYPRQISPFLVPCVSSFGYRKD